MREQEKLVETLKPYPDGSELTEVLWKTLIGNLTFSKSPARDDYRAFDAHIKRDQIPAKEQDMAREFIDAVRRKLRSRRLATTKIGYLAAVPEASVVGDWVCMLHGARHLFVLRENQRNFVYMGPTYVHGLMQGEVLRADWYEKRTLSLV